MSIRVAYPSWREHPGVEAPTTQLLAAWSISGPTEVRVPDSGTMNETWLITQSDGRAVLRRHRFNDPHRVEFN